MKLPDPISSQTWDQLTAGCVTITRGSKVVYHFKIVLNNLGFHVNNSHNRHMTCQNYNTCYSRRGSTPFGSRNSAWMCLISALGTGGVKFLGFGFYWKRTYTSFLLDFLGLLFLIEEVDVRRLLRCVGGILLFE